MEITIEMPMTLTISQHKLKVKVRQHLKMMRTTHHPHLFQTNMHMFKEVLLQKEDVKVLLFMVVLLSKEEDVNILASKNEKFVLQCQIRRKLEKNSK